jgi:hypothetical protein
MAGQVTKLLSVRSHFGHWIEHWIGCNMFQIGCEEMCALYNRLGDIQSHLVLNRHWQQLSPPRDRRGCSRGIRSPN